MCFSPWKYIIFVPEAIGGTQNDPFWRKIDHKKLEIDFVQDHLSTFAWYNFRYLLIFSSDCNMIPDPWPQSRRKRKTWQCWQCVARIKRQQDDTDCVVFLVREKAFLCRSGQHFYLNNICNNSTKNDFVMQWRIESTWWFYICITFISFEEVKNELSWTWKGTFH